MKEEAWTYLISGEIIGNKLVVKLTEKILKTFDITGGDFEAAAGQAYAYLTTLYSSFQLPVSLNGKRLMNLEFRGIKFHTADQENEKEDADDFSDFRAAETMLLTKEASEILKVTPRRVQAMIKDKILKKTMQIGRDWFLDEKEVRELAAKKRPAHRPKKPKNADVE